MDPTKLAQQREQLREVLAAFGGTQERFDDIELDKLWNSGYRSLEALQEATREGLKEAGLLSANADHILRKGAHANALDVERRDAEQHDVERRDQQQGSASTLSASRIGRYLGYTIFIMMLVVLKVLYSIMSKSVTERPTLVELLECCVEQGTWPLTTVWNIAGVWAALPMQKLVDCLVQPLAKLGTAWAAGLQLQLRGGRLAPLLAISLPATVASFLWSAAVVWFVTMASYAVMLAVCILLAVQLMPFIWKAAGD